MEMEHCQRLESLLFGGVGQGAPSWLSKAVAQCQVKYGGLALTGEFRSAIASFDDKTNARPFELFVVGEGKFGKSTLVNCLLGEAASSVRALPETRCFLRYVLTKTPAKTARFFIRAQPGQHDWLLSKLGPGVSVPSLYEVTAHRVDLSDAKAILREEVRRLDKGRYDAAILEVERDVAITNQSAFQQEIRVVDTQGLNQLFPDEINQAGARVLDDPSSLKLFMDWLNKTPRGKYLEWQFRRCDAVLWCVSGVRVGSAATAASLKYFGAYSKKIVIALTNVDRVVKTPAELTRLLARANQLYGAQASVICPIDGTLAWQSVISKDDAALEKSGFNSLVDNLVRTCVTEGSKVRNISKYLALRRTEHQYRTALRELRGRYQALIDKHEEDTARIVEARRLDEKELIRQLRRLYRDEAVAMGGRIKRVGLRDDAFSAGQLMAVDSTVEKIANGVRVELGNTVVKNVRNHAKRTTPYSLPAFDAEGHAAGNRIAAEVGVLAVSFRASPPMLSLRLDRMTWTDLWLTVVGWFDKAKADAERGRLLSERHDQLAEAFKVCWDTNLSRTEALLIAEVQRLYGDLLSGVESVYARIESEVGSPLGIASEKIDEAVSAIAVEPAVCSNMLGAIRWSMRGRQAQ